MERFREDRHAAERRAVDLVSELLALEIGDLKTGLSRALAEAGAIAGADAASLYASAGHNSDRALECHWRAPGLTAAVRPWRGEIEPHRWMLGRLLAGEIVLAPHVESMPDAVALERSQLLEQGVRSYLLIPVLTRGHFIGCVEFKCIHQVREWTEQEVTRLRLVTQAFSNVILRNQREASAQLSEERLRILSRHSQDAVFELSPDGRMRFLSPRISEMLGHAPEDLFTMRYSEIIEPEDWERLQQGFARHGRGESTWRTQIRARHRDGGLRWLEIELSTYQLGDGEHRTVGVIRDATEGAQHRFELEQRLEVERLVSRLSTRFLGRSVEDAEGGIREALAVAAGIARVDRAFLISAPGTLGETMQSFEWFAPEVGPRTVDTTPRARKQFSWIARRVGRGDIVSIPDGEALPEEAAAERESLRALGIRSYLSIPVLGDDGVIAMLGFESVREARDWDDAVLTVLRLVAELFNAVLQRLGKDSQLARDQKRLERQLGREARLAELSRYFLDLDANEIGHGIREKIHVLAELAAADHVWLLSVDVLAPAGFEIYQWWSPSVPEEDRQEQEHADPSFPWAMEVIERDEVYHIPSVDLLPPEARSERRDMIERGVKSILGIRLVVEQSFAGFLRVETLREEKVWSPDEIRLLRLAGEIFISAQRRKRAARELRQSQAELLQSQKLQAVGTLAGGIAHDFNNQLAVMLGNARLVLMDLAGPPEVLEAVSDIERAAQHCAQLTRALLSFSRRSPVESRALDVAALIDEVRALVRPMLPPSIQVAVEWGNGPLWVFGDMTQLQQVVINLVVNARDAMPGGGMLLLRARRNLLSTEEANAVGLDEAGPYIEILVRDQGVGMSPEIAGRAFEPFFTTKDVGEGTGLGLAMAYGIVKQSDGAVTIESSPGAGTSVRVFLPACDPSEAGVEGETLTRSLTGQETVLLVEDEPAVRRLLQRVLGAQGYRVIAAADGVEALALHRGGEISFDILVTDFVMPTLDGGELANRLCEGRPKLPVLFMSGHTEVDIAEVAAGFENARFLQKPFEDEALHEALRQLLECD